MTNQSDIPGMDHGMFFEHYVFDPISNYSEEDLYYIVQFIRIEFDEGTEPPHPRHFDGLLFKPAIDITVKEFTDILTEVGIAVREDIMNKLPQKLQDQFEDGEFVPYDDFGLADLTELFTKLMNFRLATAEFNTLPQKMKRQFIVFTRDGKHWRFGDRPPAH